MATDNWPTRTRTNTIPGGTEASAAVNQRGGAYKSGTRTRASTIPDGTELVLKKMEIKKNGENFYTELNMRVDFDSAHKGFKGILR
jgi:hypothetical protein